MPRIRRHNLPPQLFAHLLDRVSRRNISAGQLGLLADWRSAEPEVCRYAHRLGCRRPFPFLRLRSVARRA
jgi:hypothetical protein